MRRFLFLPTVCLALVAGALAEEPPPAAKAAPAVDYTLQPLDLLRVMVFQEPDLERQVRISQEYTINLPLIGLIDLTGKSVRQAEELIRARYDADYLKNPQITITVLEYTPRTVQVLGAVNQPGAIAFTPEQQMTIMEAIAKAGGQARVADIRKVRLTREGPDGKTEIYTINLDDLMKGSSTEKWVLQKGDVIFVPERIL
ncbi:polysaccharide biosynthesis/export family protein [Oleiharenicola sp. Vm1]|uniref:polysaccharide biosynthesis/export family protein n=1 Tax=Oleiharenicola sp. Vm1 TaxID=3398393 RepID=UPI0039F5ADBC